MMKIVDELGDDNRVTDKVVVTIDDVTEKEYLALTYAIPCYYELYEESLLLDAFVATPGKPFTLWIRTASHDVTLESLNAAAAWVEGFVAAYRVQEELNK